MFEGTITVGAPGRETITRKLATPVPNEFVAEHRTVVVPMGNTDPEARSQVTVPLVAVGSAKFTAAPFVPVAIAVWVAGTVRTGDPGSLTVTVKEPFVVWPSVSVAEHPTVVTPVGKSVPEAGEQVGVPVVEVGAA